MYPNSLLLDNYQKQFYNIGYCNVQHLSSIFGHKNNSAQIYLENNSILFVSPKVKNS